MPRSSSRAARSDAESAQQQQQHEQSSSSASESMASPPPRSSQEELVDKRALFAAGLPIVPESDSEKKDRDGFKSQVQYIMAVIGASVGLGNIWRFPAVAYENGGGAFLFPYLCMGLLFGLPMLVIDTSLGQFMQTSPPRIYKQLMPAAQGVGWTMALIVISIGFFYNVPCAWSLIYLVQLILGRMGLMTSCENAWNTISCYSSVACDSVPGSVYFNGSCITPEARNASMTALNLPSTSLSPATEEFFYFYITNKHASFEFGDANWMFLGALLACWVLTVLGLVGGVQSMGKIMVVTTVLPYLIIGILFVRGVTLEGAEVGIRYFLTAPQWEKVLSLKTWRAALGQCCFSLSVGTGTMIMMGSYNKRSHPNYRDCLIVIAADTFMSIFGGVASFAILGSMASRMGVSIDQVVASPLVLAFIAYPEATAHMPVPTLWAALFFLMVFILGISTMFVFVEGFATCIIDENPGWAKRHWLVVVSICAVCFALNVVCFGFQNGYHIFSIFNEFLGTVALSGSLLIEILILMTYYGAPRLFRDMQSMHGLPRGHFGRIFGPIGLYLKLGITVTAPLLAIAMCFSIFLVFSSLQLKDRIMGVDFVYPEWTVLLGFAFGAAPLLLIPLGAIANYGDMRDKGLSIGALFRISPDHPSLRYDLPPPVGWRHYFIPQLRSPTPPEPSEKKAKEWPYSASPL